MVNSYLILLISNIRCVARCGGRGSVSKEVGQAVQGFVRGVGFLRPTFTEP
jgi:hypothetical protein